MTNRHPKLQPICRLGMKCLELLKISAAPLRIKEIRARVGLLWPQDIIDELDARGLVHIKQKDKPSELKDITLSELGFAAMAELDRVHIKCLLSLRAGSFRGWSVNDKKVAKATSLDLERVIKINQNLHHLGFIAPVQAGARAKWQITQIGKIHLEKY